MGGVLYVVVARPGINQWGATDQEHHATWPGDQLVTRPSYVWTNAFTIQAPPSSGAAATRSWPGFRERSKFVMQRKMMLGIEQRAEEGPRCPYRAR